MIEYFPYTQLDFGKYKNCTISQIYQYHPCYIEWLIKYVTKFYIDLECFKDLPTPTPCGSAKNSARFNRFFSNGILNTKIDDKYVQKGLQFTLSGNLLEEEAFTFSEESIEILKLKLINKYLPPNWTRIDIECT